MPSSEDVQRIHENLESSGFAFTTSLEAAILAKEQFPDIEVVRKDRHIVSGEILLTEMSMENLEIAEARRIELRGDPELNRPTSAEDAFEPCKKNG